MESKWNLEEIVEDLEKELTRLEKSKKREISQKVINYYVALKRIAINETNKGYLRPILNRVEALCGIYCADDYEDEMDYDDVDYNVDDVLYKKTLASGIEENVSDFIDSKKRVEGLGITEKFKTRAERILQKYEKWKFFSGSKSDFSFNDIISTYLKYLDSYKSKKKLNTFKDFLAKNPNFLQVNKNGEELGICFVINQDKYYISIEDSDIFELFMMVFSHEAEHVIVEKTYYYSYNQTYFSEVSSLLSELYFLDFLLEEGYDRQTILQLKAYNLLFNLQIFVDYFDTYSFYDKVLDKKNKIKKSSFNEMYSNEKNEVKENLEIIGDTKYLFEGLLAYYLYYECDKDESCIILDRLLRCGDIEACQFPTASSILNLMEEDLAKTTKELKSYNKRSVRKKVD